MSTKIQPRPTQNRRRIGLEPFWAPKAVSGTRPDALGTAIGHLNAASKRILGQPGRAKSGQEPSKRVPGPPRRRSKTLPMYRPSANAAPSGFERALGSIFGRFCFVARKLRCASRTSFYSVLLGSNEVDTKRIGTPETIENQGVSASRIASGAVRATQNRARAALFERQSAREVPSGPPKNLWSARTKQLRASKSAPQAAKARRSPSPASAFSVISRWMYFC